MCNILILANDAKNSPRTLVIQLFRYNMLEIGTATMYTTKLVYAHHSKQWFEREKKSVEHQNNESGQESGQSSR